MSVVIPTHQRRDLAAAAVESLRNQTVPPATFEVVVVVDGSTDGTAERVRSVDSAAALTVVEQENRGRAGAINAGAATARGDILLFLDDDMRADPRMIAEHLRAYEELDADAVMGLIEHGPDSPVNVISEEVRREFERDLDEWGAAFGPLPDERRLIAAQFSVRRSLFDSVGGFDEAFTRRGHFGHADDDLGIRLRSAGARIVLNGAARSSQTFVRGFDSVWRQYAEYGGADVRLARKHPDGDGPRSWSLPPGGVPRALAVATLRYPDAARRAGELLRPVVGLLYQRGASGPVVRKLTYSLLFHHRYWAGVAAAGGAREVGVRGPDPLVLVLAYHRLTPPPDPGADRHTATPDLVVGQVRALQGDGWELVTPDDVAGFLRGGPGLPLRSLLLTFDDGYRDLAVEGVSVLERLGATGIAFVVTGTLDGDPAASPFGPLLDADAVRALAASGWFEIGTHSRTHAELTRVPVERLAEEVAGPIEDLVRLGLPAPRFTAYPHGDHDERVRAAASAYLGAFTVDHGLVGRATDRSRLPRISVRAGTTPEDLVGMARALLRKQVRRRLRRAIRWPGGPGRRPADAARGARPPSGGPGDAASRSG